MKHNDVRLLRQQAQALGIKYVTQYRKDRLQAEINKKLADTDPLKLVEQVFGPKEHTIQVVIPAGVEHINLKIIRE